MKTVLPVAFVIVLMILPVPFLIAGSPDQAAMHNRKGLEGLRHRNFIEAEIHFRKATTLDPENKYYYNNLAVACMNQGKYECARVHLDRSLSLDPYYVKALSNMAITSFYLRNYTRAYAYYLRARKADAAYVSRRFHKTRVRKKIQSEAKNNPEDTELQKLSNSLN